VDDRLEIDRNHAVMTIQRDEPMEDDLATSVGMTAEQATAVRTLDVLTDEQRSEVFYFYCHGCGRKQYREPADAFGCTCLKDE
jgi:hypothetical protein